MSQTQIPNILSLLTFLPLIGALIVMFLPRPVDLPEHHGGHGDEAHGEPELDAPIAPTETDFGRLLVNGVSLFFSGATLLLSLVLFGAFQIHNEVGTVLTGTARNMQFVEDYRWIAIGSSYVHYKMGVDGISLLLVVLTTFLMVLCVLYSTQIKTRLKEFMVFLLLLEAAMVGVFCALDLVLFYIFFEAMLIPMYFLIGIFGHENRIYAAVKFFIYTFAGSVFMLIAIVAVYNYTGTFDILALSDHTQGAGRTLLNLPPQALMLMFAAFAVAFMIKVPMFPFHTWLPDAHVEAPTAGSVILAGVMLKMGTYGFVRLCLPLFPQQAHDAAPLFIVLSIVGIIYASLVAAVQPDAKKLVAYSSVAHLGFVVLGIFTFTRVGMMGALVQNINHGISTPMLFFIVGMMYERRHTRDISEYGGLKKYVPMLATMLLIATLASVAVPFFNGFVGEFPVLLGTWMSQPATALGGYWPAALAATGMIWSAVYMLWWYQRLMLGPITRPVNRHLPDLTAIEWGVLIPLAALVFWFGLGSNYWTQRMDDTVETLLPLQSNGGNLIEMLNDDAPVATVIQDQRANELLHSGFHHPRTGRARGTRAGEGGGLNSAPSAVGEQPANSNTPPDTFETAPVGTGGTSGALRGTGASGTPGTNAPPVTPGAPPPSSSTPTMPPASGTPGTSSGSGTPENRGSNQ
jgi:NADH-quinone oxidoreductase subunit M